MKLLTDTNFIQQKFFCSHVLKVYNVKCI